jgi:Na+-transporting NADH:ubiquinone oxidoreductase subunit C
MSNDTPRKAIFVVVMTALICSSLVSAAVVILRPIQLNNQLIQQSRNIMQLTGLLGGDEDPDADTLLALYRDLDVHMVDLDNSVFNGHIDANTFSKRQAVDDRELSTAIPAGEDHANLGRRSRFAPMYIVWGDSELDRVILPIRGGGMWSMMYGFIALESDLNTIADVTFYEHGETPGLGDQITRPAWLAQWRGRQVFDVAGELRFRISEGPVEDGSLAALHQVDALTGATVTGDAVTSLIRYWFGPHGYRGILDHMREQPPVRPGEGN